MLCPDAESIAAFVSRSISATLEADVEAHVADCTDCRRLAFALASADAASRPATSEPARIGRFEVVAAIGSGAMGRVLRARDPELGRDVAVKVRHDQARLDVNGEVRIRREAQALARLHHANVVVVHEVGHHDGVTYLAMEYVEGPTLEAWLARPRSLREVVDVMAGVGRGLAAAHDAGLVHRDVKPSNVFVTADGAAKIGDFGLARPGGPLDLDAIGAGGPALDLALPFSVTGALVGTPAYMAPEQLRGEIATAASDQFAFCVTLYQALYGRRPFSASGLYELLAAIERGPDLPATPRVPARLRRVLARGLDADPARRFPSMGVLLAALQGRRSTGWWLAGAGLAAAVLVAWLLGAPGDPCAVPDARAATIFDRERLGRIEAALAGDGGAPAAATVRRLLADYGQRWETTRVAACRAATQGALSAVLRDGQRVCLDRRLDRADDLGAVLAAGGEPRARAVASAAAVAAAEALPDPQACQRVDLRFADREPPSPGAAAIERRIDRLVNLVATGQAGPALAEVPAVVAAVDAERDPRLTSLVRLTHGRALVGTERFAEAEPLFIAAARDAARARDDELAADAWVSLVTLLGRHLKRIDEARRWVPVADAATLRAGDPPLLRARLREQVAGHLTEAGQFDRARAELEAAIALRAKAQPGAAVALGTGYTAMGTLLYNEGRLAEARDRYLAARDLYRGALGERHPRTIEAIASVGYALAFAEPAASERYLEEARDLAVPVHGKDSPTVARILDNLGIARVMQGDAAGAAALHREAAAIFRARLGANHRGVAFALGNLGKAQIDLRDSAGAVASYRESAAILAIGSGPGDAMLARARAGLGDALQQAGDVRAAAAAYADSLAAYDGMQDRGGGDAAIIRVDYAQMILATQRSAPACAQMAIARTALATAAEGDGRNTDYRMLALAGLVTCDAFAGRIDRARLVELDAVAFAADLAGAEMSGWVGFARARGHAALGQRAAALELARASRSAFARAELPHHRAEVERWLQGQR